MKTALLPLVCFGVFGWLLTAHAKPHKKPQPAPAGTPYPEAAPSVDPSALPSVSLQPFLDTHLGRVLAPLGQAGMDQPEVIASLKASYGDGLAAAPTTRKPAYVAAQTVCDALAGAMVERQKAADALVGATATQSSAAVQPRGGRKVGQVENQQTNTFFVNSQKNTWVQRAGVLRQNIAALYQRERATEQQIITVATAAAAAAKGTPSPAPGTEAATPAAPAVAPAAATLAPPTPSVSAPGAADHR